MLVYFGFTNCPDVCPAGLQVISAALDKLGTEADGIAPLFITLDPERDTPQVIGEYVKSFHPRIVGLIGLDRGYSRGRESLSRLFQEGQPTRTSSGPLQRRPQLLHVPDEPVGRIREAFPAHRQRRRARRRARPKCLSAANLSPLPRISACSPRGNDEKVTRSRL